MKALFQDKKLLITMVVDIILTVGIPFLIRGIGALSGDSKFAYPLLFAIFTFVNGLLAYLVGDIILITYKHKHDLIDTPVPYEVALSAKHWRYPFIVAMLIDVSIFIAFAIVFSTTGHWPLM